MSDKSGNRVHLMYILLLANLDQARRHCWDSACLAHLYREMCRAIYSISKKNGRMYSVVAVLGIVSHVIHSTKGFI
ncbi:hypothetical protein HKD37_06G016135 [Glycine soja]